MSYEQPNRHTYMFSSTDYGGASDTTYSIIGPQGKEGILWDYGVQGATEIFNGSTITPKVAVGTTADPDAYGEEIDLDAVALDDGLTARSANGLDQVALDLVIVDKYLARDTEIVVTCTAATGSPTGIADTIVVIDWQW